MVHALQEAGSKYVDSEVNPGTHPVSHLYTQRK